MSAEFMFLLFMTFNVTKIMARVKCAILMFRNHGILTLYIYRAKYLTLLIKVLYNMPLCVFVGKI